MTTNDEYIEKLKSYGIDPDNLPDVTEDDILDLPRRSIEKFAARQLDDVRKLGSHGHIRLHGSSIIDHSVALDTAGNILSFLQKAVTNFGAALKGKKTLQGAIPGSISQLTQLKLTSSPLPGSIVFTLTPEASGYDELYPQPALFKNEKSPLADLSVKGILELLSQIDTSSPDASDEFVSSLNNLGPRFTQSFGELLGELSANQMNAEVVWSEPGNKTQRINLNYDAAGYARRLITTFKLDIEVMELEGVLRTLSDYTKLHLQTDDGEVVPIDQGEITKEELKRRPYYDQRVKIKVELSSGTKTGGKQVHKYRALSIRLVDDPEGMESLFANT